ncbi:MAG: LysR family transcriptional regulator [Candidatus Dormibacteraeota bacterium]|uniref:LysR family transcriptional regulator n=1 Tax=Candidatus Aeolococcus gillhamiae TaxID=3127015 RepID=A0A934JUD2_9BACT|nr:LysR family transcriptional regulator [Candidatus Dormibacteraeota bacterium]
MTLRQLATLLEVARAGSVKGAAEQLFVTQPAVSAVLASLQRELGVDLVARDGRGLRLTDAGRVLADYARRIHGMLDEAAAATTGVQARGRLRMAAVTTAGEHLLPAAIAGFRELHPTAEVSLEVANRGHVWERLDAHEVDLVVAGRPPAARLLRSRAARPNQLVIVAAPGIGTSLTAAALAGQTWLLRERGSGTRATTEEYLAALGIEPASLTLGSNGAIREAAAVGLGITLISSEAVEVELAAGRLVTVAAPDVPLRRDWHVVTRAEERLPESASLFLTYLVERCRFVPTDEG